MRVGATWAGAPEWIEARALLIVAVTAVVILCLAGIPAHLAQDGWLALVAGRLVSAHGIPQHDYLTLMAHGTRWVDQQWLAQLIMYQLERIGGLQLLTVGCVGIVGASFAGAVAAARRLGAQDLHVLVVLPLAAFFYVTTAVSIRTQELAYPLFIATLYLLASDIRMDSRRVRTWWVFPLLILWANVHGSATMGVGLAVVYGFALVVKCARSAGLRRALSRRAAAFIALSPLTLIATPYGTGMIHYYSATLLNSQFGKLVTEWRPTASIPILAVPLFVLVAGAALALLLSNRRTPLFDHLVLSMLALGAILAARNITWFGLAAVALLPAAISAARHDRPAPLRRARVNQAMAGVMIALTGLMALVTLTRPTDWFTSSYPTKAIPALDRLVARQPNVKVFADVRYADWLIWNEPAAFLGRVAYDTSLELLSPRQLRMIAALVVPRHGYSAAGLMPYGIWMLNPVNRAGNHMLLTQAGVRIVLRSKSVIIVTHPADGAARLSAGVGRSGGLSRKGA